MISQIDSAYQESLKNLEASRSKLEAERTKIIESAKKQAENLKRQIVGSSRLSARNKELLMIESSVNEAFERSRSCVRHPPPCRGRASSAGRLTASPGQFRHGRIV